MYKNINLTNEEIEKLFNSSKSSSELISKIGLKYCGASQKYVKELAKRINLDFNEWVSKIRCSRKYYSEHPKFCKQCGKELPFEQRDNEFCSHSCAASYNNLGRVLTDEARQNISNGMQKRSELFDGNFKPIQRTTGHCLNCGKELKRGKYCSIECQHEHEYKEFIKSWLDGNNYQRGVGSIPTKIKRYLMEIHNNKCEKCGWGEKHPVTGNVPLEVHHIDGDCTNNLFENLQLLCPNCHSLTENFGSKNKNSKRFHRKKLTKE